MDAGQRPLHARPIDLLIGETLRYARLGDAIVLGFSGGGQVVIETVAHLAGPDGRVEVDPREDPSDALATVLGDVIRAAHIHDTGHLTITFGGGSELSVGIDAEVESWAVAGPDGFLIVCLAHGEIAVWGDPGVIR